VWVPDTRTLRDWLREEPFALSLSAGYFGFFAHAGVIAVLEDEGLLPARLAGASAGALVAGLWAAGRSAASIADELLALRRRDFWDVAPGAGLLAGRRFRARLEAALPARAFDACRVPLAVTVFELGRRRSRVVMSGALAPAIHASCALPLLFHPVRVDGALCSDGGIADRHGLLGVAAAPRVLHHLLVARSPWRRASSPALRPAARRGLCTLAIADLPRPGPFRLELGRAAFEHARLATRAALAGLADAA
jgi:NTE family protein